MKNLTEKGIVNLEQDETLTNKELLLGWHDQVKLSSNSKWNRYCVVCGSPYVAYVRHVTNISLKKDLALFHCMECKSFVNPSGYIPDERAHESELLFHIKVEERNNQRSEWLFDYLMEAYPTVSSILEIGCGTGTLIKVAKERGYGAVGFDINKPAIEYGRKKFNVDLRAKFWTTESKVKFNMIICIMVLEHLEDPRPLFNQMADAAKKRKAKLFVSVPFLERNRWKYILDPNPKNEGTPFFNNDVHVTHFSKQGMKAMALTRGAKSATWVQTKGWGGFVFDWSE